MSDHSSHHFDSATGLAIGLGSAGPGSVTSAASSASSRHRGHFQGHAQGHGGKISSLAKDARDCGPGLTRDSTVTRPALSSSARSSHDRVDDIKEEDSTQEVTPVTAHPVTSSSAHAVDPMMASIYAPANGLNGSEVVGNVLNGNGVIAEEVETAATPEEVTVEKQDREEKEKEVTTNEVVSEVKAAAARPVPGTSLKCLEDPSFAFDGGNASSVMTSSTIVTSNPTAAGAAPTQQPKRPAYRVLEDPFEAEMMTSTSASPKVTHRVIQDPMMASVYAPASLAGADVSMTTSTVVTSSGQQQLPDRPAEVLEGARETFDKFWATPPVNKEANE